MLNNNDWEWEEHNSAKQMNLVEVRGGEKPGKVTLKSEQDNKAGTEKCA